MHSGTNPGVIGPNGTSRQGSADESPTIADDATNPRRRLVVAAARALLDALLGGDLGVAREANETIGRLLAGVQGATLGTVVDLRTARADQMAPGAPLQLELPLAPRPASPAPAPAALAGPGLVRARPKPSPDEVDRVEQLVEQAAGAGPRGGR